jgi:membrane-anchored protein YejM (alkaline phosphatase superfamily)
MKEGKILLLTNILILVPSMILIAIVGFSFTTILDFFPWGNADAYVVWELLIVRFIIPYFIVTGVVRLLINYLESSIYSKFSFFVVAILLYIPSYIGFDLATDILARWSGVIISVLLLTLLSFDMNYWIKNRYPPP